jgi:hypothetical protein
MGQAVGSTNIEPTAAFRVVADRVGLGGHNSREIRFSKGELARSSELYNASISDKSAAVVQIDAAAKSSRLIEIAAFHPQSDAPAFSTLVYNHLQNKGLANQLRSRLFQRPF